MRVVIGVHLHEKVKVHLSIVFAAQTHHTDHGKDVAALIDIVTVPATCLRCLWPVCAIVPQDCWAC